MQVNPMQLVSMIKNGSNPQQLMLSLLEQNTPNNPMAQNVMELAKNGKGADIDRPYGRMYYSDGNIRNQGGSRNSGGNSSTVGANSYYGEMMPYIDEYPIEMRDYREGRSPIARKMYMESKEMHQDPAAQMKELEHYIKELGDDVTEMIQDSTPEQKAILKQKISALAEKIV